MNTEEIRMASIDCASNCPGRQIAAVAYLKSLIRSNPEVRELSFAGLRVASLSRSKAVSDLAQRTIHMIQIINVSIRSWHNLLSSRNPMDRKIGAMRCGRVAAKDERVAVDELRRLIFLITCEDSDLALIEEIEAIGRIAMMHPNIGTSQCIVNLSFAHRHTTSKEVKQAIEKAVERIYTGVHPIVTINHNSPRG